MPQGHKREVVNAGLNESQDPAPIVMSEEGWRMIGGSEVLGGPESGPLRSVAWDMGRTARRHQHRP